MVHDTKSTCEGDEDPHQPEDLFEPCLLVSGQWNYKISMIENMLVESDIPFFTRDCGLGGYLKVLGGNSLYETALYVDKKDYEQAKDLVDAFFSDSEPDEEYPVVEDTVTEDLVTEDAGADSVFARRTVARVFIAVPLILLLALAIFAAIVTFQQLNNPTPGSTTITTSVQSISAGS